MKNLMRQFDTYIFDLYGTLVDIHTDENREEIWEKLALFYGYYGAEYVAEELHHTYLEIISCMEEGNSGRNSDAHEACPEIRIEQVFWELFAEKGVDADLALAIHAGQFFRAMSTDYIHLYEGTEEMLDALRREHKKIYLLSNAQRIFTEYEMRALKIYQYFEKIFISSDFGYKKPDPRFFEKLIQTSSISREKAIMIGNDAICDIQGAKMADLATCYVHSNLSPSEALPDADFVLEEMDMNKLKRILLETC
ncbi:MAG: HAD family hydrolase [Bariatricus sp.]